MTIPTVLQVAARRPGRPTDERRHNYVIRANTRSQQRGGFKGEGYIPNEFRVTARWQGGETDERRHTT
ncbi:hypothetical protein [Candidatus Regiella endosymbiont of Tuberolachnus salignus]|uniref:hypothetical protein n=1 Tax=Candidatus Regiella endosymbiont of Tuberolachnus salignus TaxID=3077956 RepID=UPI0030CD44F4